MERSDKMIGISVAVKKEWETTLNYFGMSHEECEKYPFGEYFRMMIDNQEVILYLGGVRKMNASASTQYMIDHFKFNKIIVVVTSEDKKYSKEYILNIYKRNSIEEKEYLEYKEKNNERLEKAYDIAYTINENDEDNIAFLENAQVEDFNFFQIIGVLTLLLVLIAIIFFNKKYRNGKK